MGPRQGTWRVEVHNKDAQTILIKEDTTCNTSKSHSYQPAQHGDYNIFRHWARALFFEIPELAEGVLRMGFKSGVLFSYVISTLH